MNEKTKKAKKEHSSKVKAALFFLLTGAYTLCFYLSLLLSNITMRGSDIIVALFLLPVIFVCLYHLLCKKTDMPLWSLCFIQPLSSVIICLLQIIFSGTSLFYIGEEQLIYAYIIGIAGFIIGIIDLIISKKLKLLPLLILTYALYVAVFIFSNQYLHRVIISERNKADITSSWFFINQDLTRAKEWKEFVTATDFALGEVTRDTDEYGWTYYTGSMGTYPVIDGSTVCVPMAVEFARQHLNMSDESSKSIAGFSTTHYAYENLITKQTVYPGYYNYSYNDYIEMQQDTVDLVIATHPSDEELAMAQQHGVELMLEPVCYDAFVFITHKDNPVESLTVQQIRDIYSGKITNWKDVGGRDEKIRAFQRDANSGSQTAMERLVMGGTDMIDPIEVTVIEGMGALVEAVAEYKNETASIGYTYRYYIDNLYKNPDIKMIAVEGITPTDENIRSGSYPYTTNYYGVIRKEDEKSTGGNFLDWMLSDEGQACIKQAGYIAMR